MTVDLVVKSNVLFYASAEAVPFDGGVTSDWCKSQVMVLRRIPAKDKTWRKGSASTSDSNPYEQVTMEEDYYMGVYPVTQNQYEKMGFTNDSSHKGDLLVGWETRADYRPIASATTGYTYVSGTVLPAFSAFSGLDFRLPSAAEWEYACRAGTSTAFNTGVDSVDADISMGWFNANAQGHPRCVGLKSPNGWGLYDMHGNVFEWCSDSIGSDHVLCGGSFLHNSDKCTSTYRAHTQAGSEITGFRLVCPCVAKPL